MNRFFSPLLIMMSVVVMVAALADRSASAGFNDPARDSASDDVIICHPVPSRDADGLDILVYQISPVETERIEEHRAHGDLLLNESRGTDALECPGNVIYGGRL